MFLYFFYMKDIMRLLRSALHLRLRAVYFNYKCQGSTQITTEKSEENIN